MRRLLTHVIPAALALAAACSEPTAANRPITGVVQALTLPTMTVAGQVVTVTSATVITRGGTPLTTAALRVGEAVAVHASAHGDGSLEADDIEVEDDGIELRGAIDSLAAPRLFVAGHVVVTDSGTRIERDDQRVPFDSLQAGDTVKVEGQLQADSTVLATEIEVKSGEHAGEGEQPDSAEAEVEGAIDSLALPDLFVAGHVVVTDSLTAVVHDGSHLTVADLVVAERVDVKGLLQSDGSIRAREIDVQD